MSPGSVFFPRCRRRLHSGDGHCVSPVWDFRGGCGSLLHLNWVHTSRDSLPPSEHVVCRPYPPPIISKTHKRAPHHRTSLIFFVFIKNYARESPAIGAAFGVLLSHQLEPRGLKYNRLNTNNFSTTTSTWNLDKTCGRNDDMLLRARTHAGRTFF